MITPVLTFSKASILHCCRYSTLQSMSRQTGRLRQSSTWSFSALHEETPPKAHASERRMYGNVRSSNYRVAGRTWRYNCHTSEVTFHFSQCSVTIGLDNYACYSGVFSTCFPGSVSWASARLDMPASAIPKIDLLPSLTDQAWHPWKGLEWFSTVNVPLSTTFCSYYQQR
jgi:hypothetical protein